MVSSNANALGVIFANSYDNLVPELVAERTMASIPFAGRYRMIDFVLSNMANAGVDNVSVIVRKNYHSLMDHLGAGREWDLTRKRGGLNIVPPFAERSIKLYSGRVDALASVLNWLRDQKERYVILSDSNIAMNFDFNKLIEAYDKENQKNLTDEQVLEATGETQEKLHVTKNKGGIVVKGIHDVAVRFSKCCSPIPGDEIVGFVTRGRGITIHRTDCVNVLNMSEMDRSRLIEAEWQPTDNKGSEKYMAEIQVYANNRTGLLVDLSKIFTERKIDMRSINSRTSKQEKATISISFEIGSKEELSSLVAKIRQVESVIDVERTTG